MLEPDLSSDATIRPFRFGVDEGLVADLLPEANLPWGWSRTFVAEAGDTGVCTGAALMTSDGPRPCVLIRSTSENAEIERKLLTEIVTTAQALRWPAVFAPEMVDPDSDAAARWRELGFQTSDPTLIYKVALDSYIASLAPVYMRLQRGGRIPADIEAKSLTAAPIEAVAKLRVATIGGMIDDVRAKLRGTAKTANFDRDLSTILVRGEDIIAICLVRRDGPAAVMVDSVAVDPRWRNGWANLVVRMACAENLVGQGIDRLHFAADPVHRDTHKAARRAGATVVARRVTPFLPFATA